MDVIILTLLIITLSLLFIGFAIFAVLMIKKHNKETTTKINDASEVSKLTTKLDAINNENKTNLELALSKEMTKFVESNFKANEANNAKLERFQTSIQESLNTRFDALNKQIQDKLFEMNKKVDEKLAEGFKGTSETFTQVREKLKTIEAAQKNIEDLSKDVIELRNVLDGNQSRGQYGEYQLSMVLHNVFGDTEGCYKEQYTIKKAKDGNDVRADAVVFVPEPNKMICIDSKFPFKDYSLLLNADESDPNKANYLKEFQAAVKKHITVIKDKYIVENKTANYAIMFIPNDGVFAFIHHNCEDVVSYAREKQVIITSPSTLPAILVTVNMVRLEAIRAKNIKFIIKELNLLGKQFNSFSDDWEKFSNQLNTLTRTRESLDKRVDKITNKFDGINNNTEIQEIANNEPNNQLELKDGIDSNN